MASLSANQILILYTWFALAWLLFFLLMIARFYQKFSGVRTHFRWFLAPIVLFGAAAVRYASIDRMAGDDLLGDGFSAAAGFILLALCALLYRLMIVEAGGDEPL